MYERKVAFPHVWKSLSVVFYIIFIMICSYNREGFSGIEARRLALSMNRWMKSSSSVSGYPDPREDICLLVIFKVSNPRRLHTRFTPSRNFICGALAPTSQPVGRRVSVLHPT